MYDSNLMNADIASTLVVLGSGIILIISIIAIIISVIGIIAMWKIYTKAGKPGWASIVPVYNLVVLYQIAGLSPWLLLLYIVPFVNLLAMPVLAILTYAGLAKSFGKGVGFTIGLIFLSPIFLLILAFGNSTYKEIPQQF